MGREASSYYKIIFQIYTTRRTAPSKSKRRTYFRVATAQGKQGIWLLTFPDRENTGNLVNLFFTQGKLYQHRENFELFENFVIKVATR